MAWPFKYPDIEAIAVAIGLPFQKWAQQCHAVSLAIVKSGLLPPSRVARGFCEGVRGQHSWVVVGNDCYAPNARILDATLWSYDQRVEGIWVGTAKSGLHTPHGGSGTIWTYGKPPPPTGAVIELAVDVSAETRRFLQLIGPMDRRGWAALANAPVAGWPAAEILAAMDDTPSLSPLVPIDVLGMLTDRNPNGLYMAPTRIRRPSVTFDM